MDDGVRAVEMRRELVDRDVRCGPLDLRHLQGRQSAGKAEDGVDFGVARERANKASADISRRADDDDSHLATSDGSAPAVARQSRADGRSAKTPHAVSTIPSCSPSVKNAA